MPDVLAENLIFQLRNEPANAIIANNYFLETVDLPHDRIINDGVFNITGRLARVNDFPIVHLDATVNDIGSPIYYFPYIRQKAGNVSIPNINIPEGTIVATGGMNGCALEVRYYNDAYYFYHDANGVNMPLMKDGEVQLCRITSTDYWNEDAAMLAVQNQSTPIVQFVCIYRHKRWHIGAFGLCIRGNDFQRKTIVGTFMPNRGNYRGCFNHEEGNVI